MPASHRLVLTLYTDGVNNVTLQVTNQQAIADILDIAIEEVPPELVPLLTQAQTLLKQTLSTAQPPPKPAAPK